MMRAAAAVVIINAFAIPMIITWPICGCSCGMILTCVVVAAADIHPPFPLTCHSFRRKLIDTSSSSIHFVVWCPRLSGSSQVFI